MKKNYDSKTDFPEMAATYSNEWTVIKNKEGKTVFVSPSCFQITGYEVEDFMKNDHLLEDITVYESIEIKQQGKSNGKKVQLNCFSIICRMGKNLHIGQHVFHETDDNGEVVYDVYVNQDISFWKEAEKELCKSKEKYEKAFAKNPCLMGFSKLDTGEYLEVNQAFYDLLQLRPEGVIGRKSTDIFIMHEAKREKYVKKLLKDGFLKDEIIEIEDRNGQKHTLSYNAEVLKQQEDLLLVAAYDLSELYKTRKELLYFNRLYEILTGIAANYINMPLEKIETGISESLRQVGELVMADRAYVFKYDLKKETATCTHEWCRDKVSPQIQNLQEIPLDTFHEYQTHRFGEVYFVEDTNQIQNKSLKEELQLQGIQSMVSIPLMHNGELLGTLGFDSVNQQNTYTNHEILILKLLAQILVNIRLRQHTQQEIDNSKERFRLLIDNAPVLINAFDSDARCVLWNKQCQQTFGYSAGEVMDHANPMELFYPDEAIRRAVIDSVTLHPVNEYLIWNPYTKSGKQITTQ